MKSPILTAACLAAAAGLALAQTTLLAAEAAADAPGRVRITDFAGPAAVHPMSGLRQISGTVPPPAPAANGDAKSAPAVSHDCGPQGCVASECGPMGHGPVGYSYGGWPHCFGKECGHCPEGEIIWEGKPCTMTGIPPIDWVKCLRMKLHGGVAACWHKTWWRLCHKHKACETECPPAGYGVHACPPGGGYACPPHACHPHKCGPHGCGPHCALFKHGWGHGHGLAGHMAEHCRPEENINPTRFGYLRPYGIQGHGHYSAAYPVNPWHFDERDGRVYAAEGWGKPMAVPIAPNVEHTYNYGWGVPSSRLTPLSHMPPDSRGIVPAAAVPNGR